MPCEDTEAQRGCATSLRFHSQQRRSPGSGPGVAGPKLVFSMLICFGDSAGCLLGPQVGNGLKAAAGVGTDRLRQLWVRDNISPPYPFSACYQGGVLWKVSELGEHPSLQSPPHHPGNRFRQQRRLQLPCPEDSDLGMTLRLQQGPHTNPTTPQILLSQPQPPQPVLPGHAPSIPWKAGATPGSRQLGLALRSPPCPWQLWFAKEPRSPQDSGQVFF